MTRQVLQWLGVAFVLLLVGGAAFALTVVKDRVRVVVQADAAQTGPEPVALLRDDLGVVARDLGELRTALGENLERLGNALDERAEARHSDVQALARDVAALRQQLGEQAAAVQALERRIAALGDRAASTPAAPEGAAASPAAAAPAVAPAADPADPAAPAAAAAAPPEPVATATATAAATAAADAAPPARPKGFLSFSLPTSSFAFGERQQYRIVPELSRVGFDAKSTLHDFSGVTSRVAGEFTADFDDPDGAWQGEVTCEAATLVTGVDGRDENMREHLDTANHPRIAFAIERFVPADGGVDAAAQTARGEVVGKMTIRGKTRELRLPVTVEVDASRRVVVTGQAPLKLSDYEVPVPSQLGVINMQDEVVVWVALRARKVAEAAK